MKLIKSIKKKITALALIGTTIGTIAASGNAVEAAETYPLDKEWSELAVLQNDSQHPYEQSLFMINSHINSYTLQTMIQSFSMTDTIRSIFKKNDTVYTKNIKNWKQQYIYNDWSAAIDETIADENTLISICPIDYHNTTPTTSPYHFNGKYYTGRGINMKNTKIGAEYSDTSPMSVYNMPPAELFEHFYQNTILDYYQRKYNCSVYSDLEPKTEDKNEGFKMVKFENVNKEKAVEAFLESNYFNIYSDKEKAKDMFRYIYSVGKYKNCGYKMGAKSYWEHN